MSDGSEQLDLTPEVLLRIALRNQIQLVLHTYLTSKHAQIFRRKASRNKDYAVAFFPPDQTEFVQALDKRKRHLIPEPNLEFFEHKDMARGLLGTNPNSALSWRYSPKLELMY